MSKAASTDVCSSRSCSINTDCCATVVPPFPYCPGPLDILGMPVPPVCDNHNTGRCISCPNCVCANYTTPKPTTTTPAPNTPYAGYPHYPGYPFFTSCHVGYPPGSSCNPTGNLCCNNGDCCGAFGNVACQNYFCVNVPPPPCAGEGGSCGINAAGRFVSCCPGFAPGLQCNAGVCAYPYTCVNAGGSCNPASPGGGCCSPGTCVPDTRPNSISAYYCVGGG